LLWKGEAPPRAKLAVPILLLLLAIVVVTLLSFNLLFKREVERAIYTTVLQLNKNILRDKVEGAIISFASKKSSLKETLKERLKEEVLNAYSVAENIYASCKKYRYSKEKAKRIILKTLSSYRFLGGKGFIFVSSLQGRMLLYPENKKLEGKNLWNWKDENGKFVIREFKATVMFSPNKEGFVNYKLGGERIAFVKLFEPLKLIIGGEVSYEDFKRFVKQVLEREKEFTNLLLIDCEKLSGLESKVSLLVSCEDAQKLKSGAYLSDLDTLYYVKYVAPWNWIMGSYIKKSKLVQQSIVVKNDVLPKVDLVLKVSSVGIGVIFAISLLILGYLFGELAKALIDLKKSHRELETLNREMFIMAYTDDLTGLSNHKKFIEDVTHPEKCPGKTFFALINIRNFREINDLFGIKEGDNILKMFGQALVAEAKSIDNSFMVYRIRGDRFGLLKCGEETEEGFLKKLKELLKRLRLKEFVVEDVRFRLDFVAGVSKNRDNLLIEAEIAEQEAKKRRMDIYVFDRELAGIFDTLKKNLVIATELREAVAQDRVIPVFQPIVELGSKEVSKYEVLMRVKGSDGKFISPGDFLPVAKKLELYNELSKTLIGKALDLAKEKNVRVSINISSEDLASIEMKNWLYKRLEEDSVGSLVCFEIVETEAFSDLEVLKEFYSKIKELGAELAVDDFGSGYSNYEYLSIIKPDYIKVDGSLVSRILESKEIESLIRYILMFAKEMNIKTVAEFVSSEELCKKVEELGFDYGQGFYFGKPAMPEEI